MSRFWIAKGKEGQGAGLPSGYPNQFHGRVARATQPNPDFRVKNIQGSTGTLACAAIHNTRLNGANILTGRSACATLNVLNGEGDTIPIPTCLPVGLNFSFPMAGRFRRDRRVFFIRNPRRARRARHSAGKEETGPLSPAPAWIAPWRFFLTPPS